MKTQSVNNQQSFGMALAPFTKKAKIIIIKNGRYEEGLPSLIEQVGKNQSKNIRYDIRPGTETVTYCGSGDCTEFSLGIYDRKKRKIVEKFNPSRNVDNENSFSDAFKEADNYATLCNTIDKFDIEKKQSIWDRLKSLFGKINS